MDSDSEGQKNQGVLVGEEGAVMIDIMLATIVGVFAVIFIVGIPITLLQLMFKGVFIDSEEDTDNINLNNDLENGNN